MLCKKASKNLLKSNQYYFEIKLDGTRAVIYANKKKKELKIVNRRGFRIEKRYPEFRNIFKFLKCDSCVLDAEIIVYNERGLPDFRLLQQRDLLDNKLLIKLRSQTIPATIVVFDILEKDGKCLLNLEIEKRKKILEESVKENNIIQKMIYAEDGMELWKMIRKNNLEGIIAKLKGSKYYPGKRADVWLKIKNLKSIDAVIVGYTERKNKPSLFGSLALALYQKNKLFYIGKVGTGWDEGFIKFFSSKLQKIKINKPLVENPPNKKIIWVKPKFVCEVEYLEVTSKRELRAPSFKRLRVDKKPRECEITQLI